MSYTQPPSKRPRSMSRRLTDRAIPSALLIGLMMACNGDGGTEPTPTPTLASITVSTSTAVLAALDQTSQFNATALDGSGNIMSGVAFTWNSSNDDVASVSGSGLVT
ncbi:MAG TPA: Ig-like domain-containing protein, partial [Longimicrobiales bacterium]|nr:Ig-like domain-containing protein [Longimicrobiales bacterium]